MGTRSTITFHSEWNDEPVATIYQQYDGYISGVGHELANFLKDKKVINGISSNQSIETGYANGIGCLAAQFIAEFKTEIGGLYLTEHGDKQDYNYKVRLEDNQLIIEVGEFVGSPEELLNYEEPQN